MAENPQLTALKSERDALMGMTDPDSVARLREVNALIASFLQGGIGGGELGQWLTPSEAAEAAGFGSNVEGVLAENLPTPPVSDPAPTAATEPTPESAIAEVVTPTPPMDRPWWVLMGDDKWAVKSIEEQATIAQTGQQMILPLATTLVQMAASWPATAAEKAAEDIREYKPGDAGTEAVARYRQAVGSTSGAAMKLMKDTMHTLFAAQGKTGAASYTQAAREAKRVGLAKEAQEKATEARIYEGAEAGAKQEYMQALATPTARERRVGQLGQILSGEGVLAKSLGAVAGAKALVVAAPALAKMTPEQRLVWTKAIKENPALAYELMARHGEETPATSPAATTAETPA